MVTRFSLALLLTFTIAVFTQPVNAQTRNTKNKKANTYSYLRRRFTLNELKEIQFGCEYAYKTNNFFSAYVFESTAQRQSLSADLARIENLLSSISSKDKSAEQMITILQNMYGQLGNDIGVVAIHNLLGISIDLASKIFFYTQPILVSDQSKVKQKDKIENKKLKENGYPEPIAGSTMNILAEDADLRTHHSKASQVILKLKKGDSVMILISYQEWAKVQYKNTLGYIELTALGYEL